jgi:hypothetical protein
VFRVLVGGAVELNKELNQAAYQLDLIFKTEKVISYLLNT